MSELTAQDVIRPFALFALEARWSEGGRISSLDSSGNETAALTHDDFVNAYAYYAVNDPLCVEGSALVGLKGAQAYRDVVTKAKKRRSVGFFTIWLWVFFILGAVAGAAR